VVHARLGDDEDAHSAPMLARPPVRLDYHRVVPTLGLLLTS
jgi:hypothetical protein